MPFEVPKELRECAWEVRSFFVVLILRFLTCSWRDVMFVERSSKCEPSAVVTPYEKRPQVCEGNLYACITYGEEEHAVHSHCAQDNVCVLSVMDVCVRNAIFTMGFHPAEIPTSGQFPAKP